MITTIGWTTFDFNTHEIVEEDGTRRKPRASDFEMLGKKYNRRLLSNMTSPKEIDYLRWVLKTATDDGLVQYAIPRRLKQLK